MSKLPFVVQPRLKSRIDRIGNEEVGIIEIERKGYLTVAEKAFINAQLSGDNTASLFIKLTRKVSSDFKLDMNAAYVLISEMMQGDMKTAKHRKIEENYKEEVLEILEEMQRVERVRVLTCVYSLLLYRVDSELEPDALEEISPELMDLLMAFYTDEESRTLERLEELQEQDDSSAAFAVEELEKK